MKLAYYIAKKIRQKGGSSYSGFIIKIAQTATALSVAVMIVSVAVVLGFKTTIRDKLYVFWGHVQVMQYQPDPTIGVDAMPFDADDKLVEKIKNTAGVTAVYPYALSSTIVQSPTSMSGLRLKGVSAEYQLDQPPVLNLNGSAIQFDQNERYARQIVLSQESAGRLNVKIGDSVLVYFLKDGEQLPKIRKLAITGIYHTGMGDLDEYYAWVDIRLLQHIQGWDTNAIQGYQVFLEDDKQAEVIADKIYKDYLSAPLYAQPIPAIYPEIFNWLALQDTNTVIILSIMAIVAVINMITALLIYIVERRSMVATLKALGMANRQIQKIFVIQAAFITLRGMVFGVAIGVLFCFLQSEFKWVKLDEAAYYMSYVPIQIAAYQVVAIVLGTLVFSVAVLIIPTFLIRKMNIIKGLRNK